MKHRELGGQVRLDAGKGSAAVPPARMWHTALGCRGSTVSPQGPCLNKSIPQDSMISRAVRRLQIHIASCQNGGVCLDTLRRQASTAVLREIEHFQLETT